MTRVAVGILVALTTILAGPVSAQQAKCLAAKTKCMATRAAGLLKCETLAETPGKPADPDAGGCVTKVKLTFDGGSAPAKGCFEKLESKSANDCVRFDDTAAAETAVDGCVASLVGAIDPPPLDQTTCGAGKKKCATSLLVAVLKCRASAQTPGKPSDPNTKGCIDKAVAKYTGGSDPAKGCFAKLEAKSPNDCQQANDAATLQSLTGNCVHAFVAVVTGATSTTSSTLVGTTTTTPTTSTTSTTTNASCPAALRCGSGCCDRGQRCAGDGTCVEEFHPTPPCTFPLVDVGGACAQPCGSTACRPDLGDVCCSSSPSDGICCNGYTAVCSATQTSCQTVSCPAGSSFVPSVSDCCPNASICGSGSLTDCCQFPIEVCVQPAVGLPACVPR